MSDLGFNKMAGATLAAVLGVMGLGIASETLIEPHYPTKPGYAPPVQEAASTGGPVETGPPDFGTLFADPAGLAELITRGERASAQCRACHTFEAGGANGTGPNLHDAFGRVVASHAGYSYSDAMQAHGGSWDFAALDEFLTSPSRAVPGTKMLFAGFRRPDDRVAMIAYLRSISPNNVPLPAPAAPATADSAAPAESAPATPG